MTISSAQDIVRFGVFELDLKAGELRKNGTKIRLPQQPVQLLAMLVERPGEILTREELRQRLWTPDVFVDFDHGLNKSIQKIREVLGDSADSPRYIETIPRTGYRFIAPVHGGPNPVYGSSIEAQSPKAQSMEVTETAGEAAASRVSPMRAGRLSRRWFLLAVSSAVLAAGAAWLIQRRSHVTEPIRSLAVLPLDNLSGDPSQDYFADGMTDELITMLAKNSTLRVVSRTSVMQYKGAHQPLPEIAKALGVDGVLEGSISRTGDKVHMTIQLIHAPSDTHLWAESYDRDANDVASLPRETAQTIAKRLHSALLQTVSTRYVNPEAHDAYLRGRYVWYGGENEEAGKYFRKATELQPDYALGWAGLAMYYGQGLLEGELNPQDSPAAAEEAGRKAVELDDSLPEAHLTLGGILFISRWDWVQADQEIGRAIELNPRYAEAYHLRAKLYNTINRHGEAIELEKKAQELDPFQRPYAMGLAYLFARQYDAAINDLRQRYETLPDDVSLHWILCEAYRRKGALKDAAQEWEKAMLLVGDNAEGISAATIRHAYERGGYQAVLLEQVSYLKQKSAAKYVSPVEFALQYAQLGRREQTLALLEEGYRQRSPLLLGVQNDPAFDFLHAEERYRSIIKQIGLPPAY